MSKVVGLDPKTFMGRPKLGLLERTYYPDRGLLKKLISVMWDKSEIDWFEDMIRRGVMEAYKTPSGLILIETAEWSRGKELFLHGIVGRDILKRSNEILADLKLIAEYKGCSMIGGQGEPKGWLRFGPKMGFKPISTHYVMELNNG